MAQMILNREVIGGVASDASKVNYKNSTVEDALDGMVKIENTSFTFDSESMAYISASFNKTNKIPLHVVINNGVTVGLSYDTSKNQWYVYGNGVYKSNTFNGFIVYVNKE